MSAVATTIKPCRIAARREPPFVRRLLIGVALAFLGLFLVVPLVSVFAEAFAKGFGFYFQTLRDPMTLERHPADFDRRRHFRSAQLRFRRRGGVGDCEVRFPRQKHFAHAD